MTGHARSRLLNCPVGGMGLGITFSILVFAAMIAAACLAVGPIHWAWWQFRRTIWRHKRFSLGGLFVYFSIIAVLIGMAAAIARGTG